MAGCRTRSRRCRGRSEPGRRSWVSRESRQRNLRTPQNHTTPPRSTTPPTSRRSVNPTCGSPAAPPRVAPSPTKRLPASRIRVTVGEGRGEGEMGACWERGACLETHTVRRVPPPKWSERNPQTPLPMSPCGPPCPILGIALWVHRPGEHLLPGWAELRNPGDSLVAPAGLRPISVANRPRRFITKSRG